MCPKWRGSPGKAWAFTHLLIYTGSFSHTATLPPAALLSVGKAAKTLTQSVPMQGKTLALGSPAWLLPPLWKQRTGPQGLGIDMGAGDIWAAFTGPLSPGTVLATLIGDRKAWTEMGGLRLGLAMLPNGWMAEATAISSNPSTNCVLAFESELST